MALNMDQIITDARLQNPLFRRNTHPNPVLISALSDYQATLIQKALAINKRFMATGFSIALPVGSPGDGDLFPSYVLPANLHVLGATHTDDSVETPVRMRTFEDRLTPRRWPSAFELDGKLVLMGASTLWESGTITVMLTRTPEAMTQLEDEFVLPDEAAPALVASAAYLMASREPAITLQMQVPFAQALSSAEKTFLATVAGTLMNPQSTG